MKFFKLDDTPIKSEKDSCTKEIHTEIFEFKNKTYEIRRICSFKKLSFTFEFTIYSRNYKKPKKYYLQFSVKDMWLLPKSELILEKIKLYGWLFIYFGYEIEK